MQMFGLFPSPIAAFTLDRKLTKTEINCVQSLKKMNNIGNVRSIESSILEKKQLSKLKEFMLESATNFFNEIFQPVENSTQLYITQSWANYNDIGHYHHKHSHANSLVSGVFYLQADPELDRITFHNAAIPQEKLKIVPKSYNPFNSEEWYMPVETNTLYLFKSDFHHSVPAVNTEKEYKTRISISFNTFIKGTFGSNISLTELILE